MTSFSARVSRPYEEVKNWVESITCDSIIVYEHEADDEVKRTHIHMLVLNCTIKIDALKTRYKKTVGDISAADWRFKQDVDDNYSRCITYMSKGHLSPKLTKGFDTADIAKHTAEWIEPKTQLKVEDGRFVRDIAQPGQKTKLELLEQMRSQLSDSDCTRAILKVIRKVLIANKVVIGQYKMMDYYDSLIMYSRKEDWIAGMERRIIARQGI